MSKTGYQMIMRLKLEMMRKMSCDRGIERVSGYLIDSWCMQDTKQNRFRDGLLVVASGKNNMSDVDRF